MKSILLVFGALMLSACLPTQPPSSPIIHPISSREAVVHIPATTSTLAVPKVEKSKAALTANDFYSPDVKSFPNLEYYIWETIVTGLERPVDIRHVDDERLFLLEKVGRIRILENGELISKPYLDISDRVGNQGNEQGLLGLAFHPSYKENGLFFLNYTNVNRDTVVARFRVTNNANIADPSSEVILISVKQPFSNHNGGSLAFGPDGYLYIGLGDGGSAGDPLGNGQKLDTFLGKILRLEVDAAGTYSIPADNPFGNEIWAFGLRNPWRISFDSRKGDLYIADVGQNQWEEINFVESNAPGGINFGWNYYEGSHSYSGTTQQGVVFENPVAEYDHSQGCSVTGGYVYRGTMPEWNGIYLYGDYCTGTIWGLIRSDGGWQTQRLFEVGGNITSFGQDASQEIYVAFDDGRIFRLMPR